MKKISWAFFDIRLAIVDGELVASILPIKNNLFLPTCEVFDIGTLPYDIAAWITLFEQKRAKG